MLHGWIILDKPLGLGSTQAVGAVKRILREAGEPQDQGRPRRHARPAGRAACCRSRSAKRPSSPGGCSTRPRPMSSRSRSARRPTRSMRRARSSRPATSARRWPQVEAVLPRFTGEIEQVPPAYSALKIDGKAGLRASPRGRRGRDEVARTVHHPICSRVQRPPRKRGSTPLPTNAAIPASAGTGRGDPFRHRLQRHLYPLPGPRHRACAWNGRPCHLCSGAPGPVRSPRSRRFRWTIWTKPLRRAH